MKHVEITAADGTRIPLTWFQAEAPKQTLLLLPALGIQSKLYDKMGALLAERGCCVCLMEQRGHGRSAIRPGRNANFGLDDILDYDMPAAMEWMAGQAPGLPRLLGGHSLGGHLSTIYAGQHPGQLAGIVHLACAFPYHRDYNGRAALLVRLLCRLIPMFALVPGYYPGQLMGFGGRESAQLMRQWSEWAGKGRFDFGDRSGLKEAVSSFTGPVISISFEQDDFATEAAIQRALSPFTAAHITRTQLGTAEQGRHLGHTGWARGPEGVVAALAQWLDKAIA